MRRLAWIAAAALAAGCGTAAPGAGPGRPDLPHVFRRTVTLPEALTKRKPVWKEGEKLDPEDLPRYPVPDPHVGDFSLYWVHRTYNGFRVRGQTAAYLLLEVITEWKRCSVRVYGASHTRWGEFVHKGVTNVTRGSRARQDDPECDWPDEWLTSYSGGSLSVKNLGYFHDYAAFAADREVKLDATAFQELENHPPWGQLRLFGVDYAIPQGVSAGREYVILSDRVPVRGVLYGIDDWSSSSGLHNHVETITLLHHGRMSADDIKLIDATDGVLPSEEALWRSLAWTGPKEEK